MRFCSQDDGEYIGGDNVTHGRRRKGRWCLIRKEKEGCLRGFRLEKIMEDKIKRKIGF